MESSPSASRLGAGEQAAPVWRAALYTRLSREDGDKPESDSISNQRALLEDFLSRRPDLCPAGWYADDGYTGTNFDRPGFRRMLGDIEAGQVNCVVVKDLSRFGRDYIDVGRYLERWFPEHGVRFLAVNDGIDSEKGPYDMLLPVKNVFNEQYARDISRKVRSAFRTKQRQGEFIGAFASYGYRKDPDNHNRLVVDPAASAVVARIFTLFEHGMGKVSIAKLLNEEGIPCPSEYKRLNGEKYSNGRRIRSTTYWTYATIHRMLHNQMYIGNMEQGRAPRQTLHGRAKQLTPDQWAVVEGTHQAIIGPEQWARVQALLEREARTPDFARNVSPFAGFLRCGDCGRAMSKVTRNGGAFYCCGSYKRYGSSICTRHEIAHRDLEQLLLGDLNRLLSAAGDLRLLAAEALPKAKPRGTDDGQRALQTSLDRLHRLRQAVYEDYREGLLSREDYLLYRADYERQTAGLSAQLAHLEAAEKAPPHAPGWLESLVARGSLLELDRATMAEAVEQILVFEHGRIEVTYTFSDDLGILCPL